MMKIYIYLYIYIYIYQPSENFNRNYSRNIGDIKHGTKNSWIIADTTIYSNTYENLRVATWISLYIINKLLKNRQLQLSKVDKKKIVKLIISSNGFSIPNYLKTFSNMDLSYDLSKVDYSHTDFS